jgi:hypothetical protein
MTGDGFERDLSGALRAEAYSVPLRLDATQLHDRLPAPQRLAPPWRLAAVLVVGLALIGLAIAAPPALRIGTPPESPACEVSQPVQHEGSDWDEIGGPGAYFHGTGGALYSSELASWLIHVRYDPPPADGQSVGMWAEPVAGGDRVDALLGEPAELETGLPGAVYLFQQAFPEPGCWQLNAALDGEAVGTATVLVEPGPAQTADASAPTPQLPSTPPSPSLSASLLPVPTAEPWEGTTPGPCPPGLVEGEIVSHPEWGVAIASSMLDEPVTKVIWPHGFTGRVEGDRIALINENGTVVGHVGDSVQLGGGEANPGEWNGCGLLLVQPSASPRPPRPGEMPLWTAEQPAPLHNGRQVCDLAQNGGYLARHPESGAGLRDRAGDRVWPIIWPFAYSARIESSGIVLIDPDGKIVAREGDRVRFGGGLGRDDVFQACGGIEVIGPGQGPLPSPSAQRQANIEWSTPVRIAEGQFDSVRIVMDRDGHAHAAAVARDGMWYLTNTSGDWATERVTMTVGEGYHGEPSIVTTGDGGVLIAFTLFERLLCTATCEPTGSQGIYLAQRDSGGWSDASKINSLIAARGAQQPKLRSSPGRLHLAYSSGPPGDRTIRYASVPGISFAKAGAPWPFVDVAAGDSPNLEIGRDALPSIAFVDSRTPHFAMTQEEVLYPFPPPTTFRIEPVTGNVNASRPLLALDEADEPHIVIFNDMDQGHPLCGALYMEQVAGTWSLPVRAFPEDDGCHVTAESLQRDAGGTLHVISRHDESGAGVWYSTYGRREFDALQLWQPERTTDDVPTTGSDMALDGSGRPHVVFTRREEGAYEPDEEVVPDIDGIWYIVGPSTR